ncbi:S41 family peptidase [Alteromonas sp. KUL49]|uniref:S41 family peptidase n=1 Tax=Alteromonas sp. KUL49 TaxID=2480798 RepID=UPI00102F1144|nr:S41 family peptidase [Alteromonas sp. KUL49]TAP39392.1 hypothetical protein EYS00_12725 [Alteromonas sp. KUL49]GEA12187.1 interphotoreceptor retinoid-binding protein [Alteromonas sp. KUL49]
MKQLLTHLLCILILLLILLLLPNPTSASSHPQQPAPVDSSINVTSLVAQTLDVFEQHYIDQTATQSVINAVNERLDNGRYNNINTLSEFAETVGRDIRNISGDLHLSLMVQDPEAPLTHILPTAPGRLTYNHAFEQVKYLYGNLGYLKFNKFHPDEDALNTADIAMQFLQHADGLIIDLRDTIGGSPYLVQHMLSYFFAPETPLWSIEYGDTLATDVITIDTQPAHKHFRQNTPLWILTSSTTASASELFAGVLQAQGKATLVGSKTAGAGYYVGVRPITDTLTFRISLAKPVLATSNFNWEQVGLNPDIPVDAVDALDAAFSLAQSIKR